MADCALDPTNPKRICGDLRASASSAFPSPTSEVRSMKYERTTKTQKHQDHTKRRTKDEPVCAFAALRELF
jgi:hypothetical protein